MRGMAVLDGATVQVLPAAGAAAVPVVMEDSPIHQPLRGPAAARCKNERIYEH